MKIFLNVLGALLIAVGGIWFLQGLNVLRRSVMSGQPRWLVIGAAMFVIGVIMLIFANRPRKMSRPD